MFPDFTNLFTSHNLEKKNTHTGKGRRFDITFVLYTDGSTIDSHSFRPYYQTRQSLVRGVCVCVCVCVRERERERETPLTSLTPFGQTWEVCALSSQYQL